MAKVRKIIIPANILHFFNYTSQKNKAIATLNQP